MSNVVVQPGGFLGFNHISQNLRFFVIWGFVYFAFIILSALVPIAGNILLTLFNTASVLYFADKFRTEGKLSSSSLNEMIKKFNVSSLGFLVGSIVLGSIIGVVLGLLYLIALSSEEAAGGLFLLLVPVLLYIIVSPFVMFSRILETESTFGSGFKAVFYPFTSRGFSEVLTGKYLVTVLKSYLVLTVGIVVDSFVLVLAEYSLVFAILLPVLVFVAFWVATFVGSVIANYILEKKEKETTETNQQQEIQQVQ